MAAVGNWKQWWVGGTVRVPAAPKISQRSCIVWSGPLLLATWFKTGSPQIVHCICALPSFDWISPYCFVCLSSPASQGTFTSKASNFPLSSGDTFQDPQLVLEMKYY